MQMCSRIVQTPANQNSNLWAEYIALVREGVEEMER